MSSAPGDDPGTTASRTAAIRVRSPHTGRLADALSQQGHACLHLGPGVVRVHDITAEELGWIALDAGVVIFEMTPEDPDAARWISRQR